MPDLSLNWGEGAGLFTEVTNFMGEATMAIGGLVAVWGIIQFGMAVAGNNPEGRMNAAFFVGGGALIAAAGFAMTAITW